MSGFDIRDFIQAASAAVTDRGPACAPRRKLRTPTAEGVVDVDVRPRYSPVVLEGAVRLSEFMIVAGLGVLVHHVYLSEVVPFDLPYATAVIGLAALTVLVFQAAGAYAVSAFRAFFLFGLRIIAAWSLLVLIALTVVFFAKIGGNFSRVWLASLYFLGAGALVLERLALSFFVSAVTRAGRFDRRASCRCWRSSGCCRSTSASRPIRASSGSARAAIPTSARCRCSTSSTSRLPTGTLSSKGCSTGSSARSCCSSCRRS